MNASETTPKQKAWPSCLLWSFFGIFLLIPLGGIGIVLFKQGAPWSSGLFPILSSSHFPSNQQPLNKNASSVRCTDCLYDKARESQSTGDSEIRWVTSTEPHVTQLAWHRLKAFGSTQQTLNSPCSSCYPLPIVPPFHLKPQSFVFTILSLFLLRFLVFHSRLYFCFLEKQAHILSGQLISLLCFRANPSSGRPHGTWLCLLKFARWSLICWDSE